MSNTPGNPTSTDRIVKQAVFDATQARLWNVITDVTQFNKWFGVAFASPFVSGEEVTGKIATPGFEHLTARLWIERIDPETLFSFRWHPHAVDPAIDYSREQKTLVTFTLAPMDDQRTQLTIVESGFDAIPASRRDTAFDRNSGGWTGQLDNIRNFLARSPN